MTGVTTKILLVLIGVILIAPSQAQEKSQKSILLTGVVMDLEERDEMPYVNVKIRNSIYGTATDINGYFSLFANPGDTIIFSSVGYQDAAFIMPLNLEEERYALLQLMIKDTLLLEEVVIFPWPDYNDFIEAFLDAKPKDNTQDLIVEVKQDIQKSVKEAEQSKYYYDQQRYQRLFMMHQIFPPNNFLDPSRWADFIRDLRTDDENREEEEE